VIRTGLLGICGLLTWICRALGIRTRNELTRIVADGRLVVESDAGEP
jgi:hypothetical protein